MFGMAPSVTPDPSPTLPETESARPVRLRREAEMLARGRVQLDAGQGRSGQDLNVWLNAWEGDGELPSRRPAQ